TERQLAILLTIYLDPPPHTVRGLAEKLKVTKPVITRALDTMSALKLVSRRRDERDQRNVLIRRTVEGAPFVERLGAVIGEKARELSPYYAGPPPSRLPKRPCGRAPERTGRGAALCGRPAGNGCGTRGKRAFRAERHGGHGHAAPPRRYGARL